MYYNFFHKWCDVPGAAVFVLCTSWRCSQTWIYASFLTYHFSLKRINYLLLLNFVLNLCVVLYWTSREVAKDECSRELYYRCNMLYHTFANEYSCHSLQNTGYIINFLSFNCQTIFQWLTVIIALGIKALFTNNV